MSIRILPNNLTRVGREKVLDSIIEAHMESMVTYSPRYQESFQDVDPKEYIIERYSGGIKFRMPYKYKQIPDVDLILFNDFANTVQIPCSNCGLPYRVHTDKDIKELEFHTFCSPDQLKYCVHCILLSGCAQFDSSYSIWIYKPKKIYGLKKDYIIFRNTSTDGAFLYDTLVDLEYFPEIDLQVLERIDETYINNLGNVEFKDYSILQRSSSEKEN